MRLSTPIPQRAERVALAVGIRIIVCTTAWIDQGLCFRPPPLLSPYHPMTHNSTIVPPPPNISIISVLESMTTFISHVGLHRPARVPSIRPSTRISRSIRNTLTIMHEVLLLLPPQHTFPPRLRRMAPPKAQMQLKRAPIVVARTDRAIIVVSARDAA